MFLRVVMILKENETLTKVNDDISLIQNKNGLTFGTDALLLAAFIRKQSRSTAAEFGGGSGIISLLCAKRKKFNKIYCVEIQAEYFDIIGRNVELNNLSEYIEPVCTDVRDLNIEADVVFTNPPYLKLNSGIKNQHDDKYIARHEVYGDIESFCKTAAKILKFGGLFYIVYRPDRMVDLLLAMRHNNIEPKRMVIVYNDVNHIPCLILVEGKKGSAPSLFVPKPFYINDMEYIYTHGEFPESFLIKNL
ncbi:MAG: methyltransferase [Oscillospiraceae bacterium]|nr:methyltransferase [Oscillospiraceae bacterium]